MFRRTLLSSLFLLTLALPSLAQAQDIALRFYVVPKVQSVCPPSCPPAFRPKYFPEMGVNFDSMDYGLENTFLVGAMVSSTQHTSVASNIDVISIPQNIDATIGLTALDTVRDRLEGLHVPAAWVTTSHTYRAVISAVGKIFMFAQRYHGLFGQLIFPDSIALDTQINQLSQAAKDRLAQTASSLNLDYSSITNTMTLRQALTILGSQIPPFSLAGQTF